MAWLLPTLPLSWALLLLLVLLLLLCALLLLVLLLSLVAALANSLRPIATTGVAEREASLLEAKPEHRLAAWLALLPSAVGCLVASVPNIEGGRARKQVLLRRDERAGSSCAERRSCDCAIAGIGKAHREYAETTGGEGGHGETTHTRERERTRHTCRNADPSQAHKTHEVK